MSFNITRQPDVTLSAWRPIPPSGFVCLGDVVSAGRPDKEDFACVSMDLLVPGENGWDGRGVVWDSSGCSAVDLSGNCSNSSTLQGPYQCAGMYTDAQGTLRVVQSLDMLGAGPLQWTFLGVPGIEDPVEILTAFGQVAVYMWNPETQRHVSPDATPSPCASMIT